MTIAVDTQQLSEALSVIGKITQVSSNTSVNKCVFMIAKGGKLQLRGTDMITYAERVVPYEGQDEGVWLVVYESFAHYVKSSDGIVGLTPKENEMLMESGNDKASAKLRDPKEYVGWPDWKDMQLINCDVNRLVSSVDKSAKSVSTSLVTPFLYCVSVVAVDNGLIDVQASNGYRYQYYTVKSKAKAGSIKVLIPHNAAVRFSDISLPATEMGISDNLMGVKSENGTYFFNLANDADKYPVFRNFDKPKPSLIVELSTKETVNIFNKSLGFTDDKDYKPVKIKADKRGLFLKVESNTIGSYIGAAKSDKAKGNSIEMSMDASHITQFLSLVTSDKVRFVFSEIKSTDKRSTQALVLQDPDDPDFFYLTYPLYLEGDKAGKAEEEPKP